MTVKEKLITILKTPQLVFVILALPFGILSAILVPQLSVNDEGTHFYRSYSVASGNITGNDCVYPASVQEKIAQSNQGNYSSNYSQAYDNSKTVEASCGASNYSPLMHLPQALGIFLSKLFDQSPAMMVLLGRVFNLLVYVAALYIIIKNVRIGKWVFATIGLFPLMIHIAASLSYDMINNIAILAFVALVLNLFTQKGAITNKQFLILIALSGLAVLTKLTNVLLLGLLLFLPVRLFQKKFVTKWSNNTKKIVALLIIFATSFFVLFIWQKISYTPIPAAAPDNPLNDNPFYFLTVLYNTYINPFLGYNDLILRGVVGDYSSFKYHMPTLMVVMCFALLTFTLLLKDVDEERLMRGVNKSLMIVGIGILIATVLATTYVMFTAWAILPRRLGPGAFYADGVQGRYFTALLVLLIPLGIWLRRFIKIEVQPKITAGILVFSISALSLVFYTVQTYMFIT